MDYSNINFLMRKTVGWIKPRFEKDGFKEVEHSVYDLRVWNEIRSWAR